MTLEEKGVQDRMPWITLFIVGVGAYWAWGILAASHPEVLSNVMALGFIDSVQLYLLVRLAVLALVILFAKKFVRKVHYPRLSAIAATCMIGGLWLSNYAPRVSTFIPAEQVVGIALIGVGYVGLLLSWGSAMFRIPSDNQRWLGISGSVLAGFLMVLVGNNMPENLLIPTFMALPVVCAFSIHFSTMNMPPRSGKVTHVKASDQPTSEQRKLSFSPILVLTCIVLAVPLSFFKYYLASITSAIDWPLVITFALILTLMVWVADRLIAKRGKGDFFSLALHFVPLLFAGMLALPLIDRSGNGVVAGALIYSGAYLLRAFLYSIIGTLSYGDEKRHLILFSVGSCAILIGHMIGSLLAQLSSISPLFDIAWMVAGVAYVIFLAGINISPSLKDRIILPVRHDAVSLSSSQTESETAPKSPFSAMLEKPCHRAAIKYALSEREEDILVLLMAGRNVSTISETLYLSQNTVKSHMNRLYKKMGVHSREELIMLVEKFCEE